MPQPINLPTCVRWHTKRLARIPGATAKLGRHGLHGDDDMPANRWWAPGDCRRQMAFSADSDGTCYGRGPRPCVGRRELRGQIAKRG